MDVVEKYIPSLYDVTSYISRYDLEILGVALGLTLVLPELYKIN